MKYKILIADENSELTDSLDDLLTEAGYEIVFGGADFYSRIDLSEVPDLLIASIKSGTERSRISKVVKGSANWRTVPILLLGTAEETTPAVIKELADGANEYLKIPYNPIRLATVIARLIEHE